MKNVLIIGGSSGIGFATAEIFLEKGYAVYNASRRVCPDKRVKNFYLDVSELKSVSAIINQVFEQTGKIDIIIYSSGFSMAAPIEQVKIEDYLYLFDVNLFGFIETVKAAAPFMKNQKSGKIIGISSLGSTSPIAFDPYYSASKAAIDMFCTALHLELQKHNVWVTSLLPGGTRTAFSFKRKIYNEKQNLDLAKAVDSLYMIEQKGMSKRAVAKDVYKISKKKKPSVIVVSGGLNKLLYLFSRFIPKKILIGISKIIYFKNPYS